MRLTEFYKKMVIFGLAPSTKFLESVVSAFEEKVIKPGYIAPQVPHGAKVPNLVELSKQKPFNKYFVYSVSLDGKLRASHISLVTIMEIYQSNKHCLNLQELLRK